MKFTGIIASLAVASTAYSAAIPQLDSLPIGQLNMLTEKVSGVQSLVGGLLGGVPLVGDLTQNTQLQNLQSGKLPAYASTNDGPDKDSNPVFPQSCPASRPP